jgi:hypothetical protein
MTYTPARVVVTPRAIPDNILAWAIDATRQADALTWAGNGNLKLIKEYSKSVANRLQPVYPSVAFAQDDDAQDLSQTALTAAYSATFEFSVQNAVPDTAVTNARVYARAFMSLFANCPDATLLANTGARSVALHTMETSFDPIKTNEQQNDFLQQFQVRVTYALWE